MRTAMIFPIAVFSFFCYVLVHMGISAYDRFKIYSCRREKPILLASIDILSTKSEQK